MRKKQDKSSEQERQSEIAAEEVKEKKGSDVLDEILVRDRGIWGRFFKMLWKAKLPWLWILAYIICTVILTNVGVSVTEYTAEMLVGNFGSIGTELPVIGSVIINVLLAFVLFTVINLIIAAIETVIVYVCQARIDRNLRRMVWGKIVRLPMSYFDKNQPRELITRITSDTSTISTLITQVIIPVFTGIYTLFVVFKKVGDYDESLMWSLLLVVPFVLAVAFMMGKLRFGINDVVNRKAAEMTRQVSEKVNNVPLIKSFATEEKEIKSGVQSMREYYKSSVRSSWITNLSNPIYAIVGVLQLIVIVLIGRNFYAAGAITLAQWIAYLEFSQQIANQLQAYAGYWASFKSAQGATRRVTYIMDEINETLGTDKSADAMSGSFVFDDVSFSYGEKKVLDHISVTIPEGKITAFIGVSGGGKTTMLNLLERFYTPQEGTITVGGEDINGFNMKSYRESIAYITQESTLLSGTIRDNILYGVKREVPEEELNQACRAASAYDFIMSFPEGYDTDVGENGSRLSGGQKQRIALARAMLKQIKYVFMDEATGAMDAKAKEEVWVGLENLMSGKTTVMVAHDYQTASHADFIVVVDHGKIADSGTKEELYQRNAFFRNFADAKEA